MFILGFRLYVGFCWVVSRRVRRWMEEVEMGWVTLESVVALF